jgi:subtilisin family serine protease
MCWPDKRVAVGLWFCVLTSMPAPPSQSSERTHVDGEILVLFRAAHAPTRVQSTPEGASFGVPRVDSFLGLNGFYAARGFVEGYDMTVVPLARTFLVKCSAEADEESLCLSLRQLPEIEAATPNLLLRKEYGGTRTKAPTGTRFDDQWYFHDPTNDAADLDAPEAWAITRGSSDVVIGIHDTGIMVDVSATGCYELHGDLNYQWTAEDVSPKQCFDINDLLDNADSPADPDTIGHNVIGYNFAPFWPNETDYNKIRFWKAVPSDWVLAGTGATNEVPSSMNCVRMSTHGTRVASIAAARWDNNSPSEELSADIVGLANECRVYIVRAAGVDDVSPVRLSDEIDALTHAALHARVINMSWGFSTKPGPDDQNDLLKAAVDFATDTRDCVLVSITHNQGLTNKVYWPAAYPNVLAVGAINRNLTLCSYSNYKSDEAIVDVVATVEEGIITDNHVACVTPFGTVPCPCVQEESVNYSMQGTSFAAPQVSGVAALIRTRFPGLTEDRVRARIKRSAEYYWAPADTFKFGAGKVNAYRSVTEWGSFTGSRVWKQFAAGDTLVESRDGNYFISGDIVIEPGATLTIQADTIRVAPDIRNMGSDAARVEIIVKGTLNIAGTAQNPVVFEGFTDSAPTEQDWVGIRFEPGSKGTLKNVVIRNATQDVVVDQFSVSVSTWDQKKTLYLNSNLEVLSDMAIASDEALYFLGSGDVVVTAGSGVDITVNGSLICRGVGLKKPEFRSSTGAPQSWGLLTLSATSQNNVFHNAIIRNAQLPIRSYVPLTVDSCLFEGGIDGIQSNNHLVVKNTTIHDMAGNALVWNAGNLELRNVELYNTPYGVFQPTATSPSTFLCRDSRLHDITVKGIHIASSNGGVTIKRTAVEDANDGVYLAVQTSVVIDSCRIRQNDIGISVLGGTGARIRHCMIDNNTTTGVYLLAYADYANTVMELDTVQYNPVGVHFYSSSGGWVKDTRIVNNSLGLKCELNSSPVVRNTRIAYGATGVFAGEGSNPDLGHATGGTCGSGTQEGKNSIHDNTTHHVANFDPAVTVYAECNWWNGTPAPSKFYGNVDYTPYQSNDPNPSAPVGQPPGLADGPYTPRPARSMRADRILSTRRRRCATTGGSL